MAFPNQVNLVEPDAGAETGSGETWLDLANSYDSSDTTYARVDNSPFGSDSKSLELTDFDFSWFDEDLYDVTGVTLVVKSYGQAADVTFKDCILLDENGADLGSDFTNAALTTSEAFNTYEQTISIPYATYSSSNFGIRIVLHNGHASSPLDYRLYKVELVLQFARKKTTADYGFEVINVSGVTELTQTAAFVHHIDIEHKDGTFTGTISLPDFDDTKGVLYMAGHYEKFRSDSQAQQTHAYAWTSSDYLYMRGHSMEIPTINWNNSTKVLTISTGDNYPLSSGWDVSGELTCGWSVVAVHYK